MNSMKSRSQIEVENLLRKFYGAENDLNSVLNEAGCGEQRNYLQECATLYKELGNLLFLCYVSEGMNLPSMILIDEPHESPWMNFREIPINSKRLDIISVVDKGHREAIIQIEETLDVPGVAEDIVMVLKKGMAQIISIANGAPKI